MPEFCTCGAQLPPDALFCHKCGKPQRELVVPETLEPPFSAPAPAPAPVAPPPPKPLPLNFHNPAAVRIALLVAGVATLLSSLLPILNWLAAGFFAVFLYGRKTGSRVDVASGVKIGWITGLITYCFFTIVFEITVVPEALSGRLGAIILEKMKSFPSQDPMIIQQTTALIQSGQGIAMMILFALAFLFVCITCLSMAGGALGAKMVGRS